MGHTSDKSRGNQPSDELAATPLFPDLELGQRRKQRTYGRIGQAIWTDNKAHFVRQYLAYFVQITKHGAYIDGFAGPQSFDHLDAWTAALVLKGEPKWLRHFFLCEITRKGVKALKELEVSEKEAKDKRGRKLFRNIEILHGDFNLEVDGILASGKITQKEATFCLLDQRTFECHWSTLQKLANYKTPPMSKIELLYFLGVGWLHRAFSGIRKPDGMLKWWGRPDWQELTTMRSYDIAELVRERFRTELGYKNVAAYPIFDKDKSNKVMYYMIHASDHEDAPALMVRAHRKAVRALPKDLQLPLFNADAIHE
jgi:three-Cys-motif partner protein